MAYTAEHPDFVYCEPDEPEWEESDGGEISMANRVYLAARYSRHPEMREYASDLTAAGYDVQAEWITGVHDGTSDVHCALIDYDEVMAADVVVSFTEPPGPAAGRGRGGRHVEFGVALALGKRCVVVGHRENVFHHHPRVEFYSSWPDCLNALADSAVRAEARGED